MTLPCDNWKNKSGTSNRDCSSCGSWKSHWIKCSGKTWPTTCSVVSCSTSPTLGAHIYHSDVSGERIVPMCGSCNKLDTSFSLKGGINLTNAIACP